MLQKENVKAVQAALKIAVQDEPEKIIIGKNNPEFLTQEICDIATKLNPNTIKYVPHNFQTQEMVNLALKENNYYVIYIAPKFLTNKMIFDALESVDINSDQALELLNSISDKKVTLNDFSGQERDLLIINATSNTAKQMYLLEDIIKYAKHNPTYVYNDYALSHDEEKCEIIQINIRDFDESKITPRTRLLIDIYNKDGQEGINHYLETVKDLDNIAFDSKIPLTPTELVEQYNSNSKIIYNKSIDSIKYHFYDVDKGIQTLNINGEEFAIYNSGDIMQICLLEEAINKGVIPEWMRGLDTNELGIPESDVIEIFEAYQMSKMTLKDLTIYSVDTKSYDFDGTDISIQFAYKGRMYEFTTNSVDKDVYIDDVGPQTIKMLEENTLEDCRNCLEEHGIDPYLLEKSISEQLNKQNLTNDVR